MRGRMDGMVSKWQDGKILAKGVAMMWLELEGKVDDGPRVEVELCPGRGLSNRMEDVIG